MNRTLFSLTCLGLMTAGLAAVPTASAKPCEVPQSCITDIVSCMQQLPNAYAFVNCIGLDKIACASFKVTPDELPAFAKLVTDGRIETFAVGTEFYFELSTPGPTSEDANGQADATSEDDNGSENPSSDTGNTDPNLPGGLGSGRTGLGLLVVDTNPAEKAHC
ncbi:MAG TPA: hypothetical protein VM286_01355 [Candidatus Thermoplasmatota archaeon]|nr:hypothetical protein [Candidatus Thermoplasmatota archaeon]